MKCEYHRSVDAISNCSKCNTPLCGQCVVSEDGKPALCSRCFALTAVSDFGDAEKNKAEQHQQHQQREDEEERKKERRKKIPLVIIALALIIVPIQLFRYFKAPADLLIDKTNIEEVTDICILNLLEISDQLQQGKSPGKEFRCPFDNRPYIVTDKGDDIVVHDPNPALHELSELRVSRNHPEPEIID